MTATETQVEIGTSQSKSETSFILSNSAKFYFTTPSTSKFDYHQETRQKFKQLQPLAAVKMTKRPTQQLEREMLRLEFPREIWLGQLSNFLAHYVPLHLAV